MKRRAPLDPRRAKLHRNYTIADAAKLFGVHRNTVRAWIAAGLETVKTRGGILILGECLRGFLEKRRSAKRCKTPPGWLYCFGCRRPREPAAGMTELVGARAGTGNVRAICGHCGALMHRRVSLAKLTQAGFSDLDPSGASHT